MHKQTMRKIRLTAWLGVTLACGPARAHEARHPGHGDVRPLDGPSGCRQTAQSRIRNPPPHRPGGCLVPHPLRCHCGKGEGSTGLALDPKPANLKAISAHYSDGDLA